MADPNYRKVDTIECDKCSRPAVELYYPVTAFPGSNPKVICTACTGSGVIIKNWNFQTPANYPFNCWLSDNLKAEPLIYIRSFSNAQLTNLYFKA